METRNIFILTILIVASTLNNMIFSLSLHEIKEAKSVLKIAPFNPTLPETNFEKSYPTDKIASIENWNDILAPISQSNSLVHVTSFDGFPNFGGISPSVPLILLSLRPVAITILMIMQTPNGAASGTETTRYSWARSNVKLPINDTLNLAKKCPKYFYEGQFGKQFRTFCHELNYKKFALASKPWTGEIRIGINPPNYSIRPVIRWATRGDLVYPSIWFYNNSWPANKDSSSFPSKMSKINVLIVDRNVSNYFFESGKFASWAKLFFNEVFDPDFRKYTKLQMITDTFLIFEINGNKITTIQKLRLCPHCLETTRGNMSGMVIASPALLIEQWKFSTLDRLMSNHWIDNMAEMTNWWARVDLLGDPYVMHQDILAAFQLCKDDSLSSNKEKFNGIEFFNRALVHVWLSVMKNYTLKTYQNWANQCSNAVPSAIPTYSTGIALEQYISVTLYITRRPKLRVQQYFPVWMSNSVLTLRFVSCGRPHMSGLAFSALIDVFDTYIWLLIWIVILLLTIYQSIILMGLDGVKLVNVCETLINFLRIMSFLLEQSETDKASYKSIFRKFQWRFPFGVFSLSGIVLSNCYRNTNVYNMIKPRIPVPYENFDQLITGNFSIYTRDTQPYWDYDYFPQTLLNTHEVIIRDHEVLQNITGPTFTNSKKTVHNHFGPKHLLMSEVRRLHQMLKHGSFSKNYVSEKELAQLEKVIKHSKYYPEITAMYEKAREDYMIWKILEFGEKHTFQKHQNTMLEKIFSRCNKVAFILPEHMCRDLAAKEMLTRNHEDVFVGKESYLGSFFGFELRGYIFPQTISRIKGIETGGIWTRWENLISHSSMNFGKRKAAGTDSLHVPTMEGNMLVIFAVLFLGICLASVVFGIEKYCRIK